MVGRNRQLLLAGDSAAVSWSPDGRRIAFIRGSYNGDLYTADRDGHNATRITRDRRDEALPDWQPRP
jgi:Tol biopolymer transport system component